MYPMTFKHPRAPCLLMTLHNTGHATTDHALLTQSPEFNNPVPSLSPSTCRYIWSCCARMDNYYAVLVPFSLRDTCTFSYASYYPLALRQYGKRHSPSRTRIYTWHLGREPARVSNRASHLVLRKGSNRQAKSEERHAVCSHFRDCSARKKVQTLYVHVIWSLLMRNC